MLGFLERYRLIRKGLASGKVRRRRSENELLQALETAVIAKWLIFAAFVAGLAVIIFSSADTHPAESFLIGLLITATAITYLWISHPQAFAKNSRVLLIFGTFLAHLFLLKMALFLGIRVFRDLQFGEVLLPFAFAPLVCSVLLGREKGLYAAIFASLLGWTILRDEVDSPDDFLFMSLICGFIAVYVTLQVRRRSRLIRAGVFVGLATWILAILFQIIPIDWEQFPTLDWGTIAGYSIAAVASGIFTSMLVGGALPLLESLFEITTDISWLELADLNHPLLRRMTIEAPGTYHHSLVVANLAEAAAEAVGGTNPTMCRVGAYFHDIGKLVKPEYFTENMSPDHDPHLELAPTMSALIIIAHVKEGVDLALKYKLNQEIIDVIQQHHGTTLVYFFHKRALQQQEDARQGGKIMNIREEDIPEVRDESFRYPGPRPQSRECAIISLADAIESASRSMEKVTPQKIDQLINDLIAGRIEEHQLDECDLTLREIKIMSDSFKFTLRSMLHSRIAYPGEGPAKETQKPPQQESGVPPVSAA